ncbi:MAG: hypothetical protein NZ555_02380, partial [Geminicoccaceae bacterium]|nr:hypothetical protein [Geminicoccaceae bacterium]
VIVHGAEGADLAKAAVAREDEQPLQQPPADPTVLKPRLDAQRELGRRAIGERVELAECNEPRADESAHRQMRLGQGLWWAATEKASAAGFGTQTVDMGEPGGPVPCIEAAEPDCAGPARARHRRSDLCSAAPMLRRSVTMIGTAPSVKPHAFG